MPIAHYVIVQRCVCDTYIQLVKTSFELFLLDFVRIINDRTAGRLVHTGTVYASFAGPKFFSK